MSLLASGLCKQLACMARYQNDVGPTTYHDFLVLVSRTLKLSQFLLIVD